ncbi:MAG: hypothetical protein QGG04_09220 [Candidatus Marinimicrobia bacterium]|jgi:hypothetical protein|nr:hypothetical protein [Chloroflexota bacterium]MDP6821633.1 hypothetical protein [Candidatus Neomarinimicrobiota bacterium]|tara:strand:+ start:1351 stop:1563 length:213 start_codon:yes stop_codon:yes gene_type:complete
MTYKTKEQFIASKGLRRLGLVEYIKNLEHKGLSKLDVQAELLKNKVVASPRMLDLDWRFYEEVKDEVRWV